MSSKIALATCALLFVLGGNLGGNLGVVAAAPNTQAQAGAPSSSPALTRLASCVAGRKQLAVVVLVDESGSLKKTDPTNSRVAAAQVAATGLADLVRRSGKNLRVDVQVAGFGVDFEQGAQWVTVGPESTSEVSNQILSFADRNRGIDTDYVNALQGALESVRTHAQAMPSADGQLPCTAVIWFTDGKFDVEDRLGSTTKQSGKDNRGESQSKDYAQDIDLYAKGGGASTVARGKEVLCNSGGLADQFRSSETSILGVALTTGIDPADQDFLRSVVTGPNCGAQDGTSNGDLLAGDLSQLIGFFDQVVTELGNPSAKDEANLSTCPLEQTTCPQGTKTFEVDGALERFHVLAQVDAPGIAVRLTAPGATPLNIPVSGSPTPTEPSTAGPNAVTWAWLSADALTIDAESSQSGANWAGTWSVTFVDTTGSNPGAPVRAKIYLFGDVLPEVADKTQFRAGEKNPFTVRLTRTAGTPIPPTSLSGEVRIVATVTDPQTKQTVDLGPLVADGEVWKGEYTAPLDISASSVNLSLTADVTTRTGIALAPTVSTAAVSILPPAGYPTVRTRNISVGPLIGTQPVESKIAVQGSNKADTCVWLSELQLQDGLVGPGEIEAVVQGSGGSQKDCLKIAQGKNAELILSFTPQQSQRGLATGTLKLATKSVNLDDIRAVSIPFDAQLVKPASAGTAWAIFALLLLLGVGIPLLAFYLTNYLVGKFAPLQLLQSCSVPINLSETAAMRSGSQTGSRILVAEDFNNHGFVPHASTARLRAFTCNGVDFKSQVSKNPFRPPSGVARVANTQVFGSDRGNSSGSAGKIPLWVTGEWVFIPDPVADTEAPVTGMLIAFVLATERNQAIEKLNERLIERLPSLAATSKKLRATQAISQPTADPVSSENIWDSSPFDSAVGGATTATAARPAPPATSSTPTADSKAKSTNRLKNRLKAGSKAKPTASSPATPSAEPTVPPAETKHVLDD